MPSDAASKLRTLGNLPFLWTTDAHRWSPTTPRWTERMDPLAAPGYARLQLRSAGPSTASGCRTPCVRVGNRHTRSQVPAATRQAVAPTPPPPHGAQFRTGRRAGAAKHRCVRTRGAIGPMGRAPRRTVGATLGEPSRPPSRAKLEVSNGGRRSSFFQMYALCREAPEWVVAGAPRGGGGTPAPLGDQRARASVGAQLPAARGRFRGTLYPHPAKTPAGAPAPMRCA